MNSQSQQVKAILAVASLVVGLLWGANAMVAESTQASWFGWSFLFLLIAAALWFWMYREQRGQATEAESSMKDAEKFQKELDAAAQAQLEAEASAEERVARAVENIGVDTVDEDEETVDGDAVFESEAVPVVDASKDDVEADDEAENIPVAVRAEEARPEPEEIVEDAKAGEEVAETEVAEAEAAPADDEDDIEIPVTTTTTVSDEPDDLTRVEGIGPKYAELLAAGGIDTFAKLAALSNEEVETVIKEQGGRRSGSMGTWIDQAKLAAAGDWDALDKLQEELTGGRRD